MFLTPSPLRTDLAQCYTPNFQCLSTTRKRNTVLSLTETDHNFFVVVMSTIFVLRSHGHRLILVHIANSMETLDYSTSSGRDVLR